MINELIGVIDRLIQLKQYRKKRLKKIFDDLLEPMHKDLALVHSDYLEMFTKTQSLLPTIKNGVLDDYKKTEFAIEYLKQQRIRFEPLRVRLRTLGGIVLNPELQITGYSGETHTGLKLEHSYIDWLPVPAQNFLIAIDDYFPSPDVNIRVTYACATICKYENLKHFLKVDPKFVSYHIQEFLEEKLSICRSGWENVCNEYLKLKLEIAAG